MCPQTVWTDLFQTTERWIEGDARERIRKDAGPWTVRTIREKTRQARVWLLIAWWTGGAWVLYFADAPTLVHELATFAPGCGEAYIWIGIFTFTTYVLAGSMREQICLYMCPWPRIQAALTDEYALNVTYRYDRGEPRISLKQATLLRAQGKPAGDCVDCGQCVAVCPTGVDIRHGASLGCIQCGLCIDACDGVMEKIGRPTRLIAYDTEMNIKRRQCGETVDLQADPRADHHLRRADRRHRRLHVVHPGDARRYAAQRAARPQSADGDVEGRQRAQRLYDPHLEHEGGDCAASRWRSRARRARRSISWARPPIRRATSSSRSASIKLARRACW